jgi:6-phosphogluconolactonase
MSLLPNTYFVYVSNAHDGEIQVLRLDADEGVLSPHARIAADVTVMPMALDTKSNVLYAATRGENKHLYAYALSDNGAATLCGKTRIDTSLAYLCADPLGRFLLGASYGEHTVTLFRKSDIETGHTTPLHVVADIDHAHAGIFSSDGRFAYVSSLGANKVYCFAVEDEGRLREVARLDLRKGFGPRHLRLSADNTRLYVLSEFQATVAVYECNPSAGTFVPIHVSRRVADIAHLDDGFARPNFSDPVQLDPTVIANLVWAADIHCSPDGRFVYASERTSSQLLVYRLSSDGAPVIVQSVVTEAQPRGFKIDPSGRFLVACGEKSSQISLYRIDGETGFLILSSSCVGGRGANWVEIVAASPDRP